MTSGGRAVGHRARFDIDDGGQFQATQRGSDLDSGGFHHDALLLGFEPVHVEVGKRVQVEQIVGGISRCAAAAVHFVEDGTMAASPHHRAACHVALQASEIIQIFHDCRRYAIGDEVLCEGEGEWRFHLGELHMQLIECNRKLCIQDALQLNRSPGSHHCP